MRFGQLVEYNMRSIFLEKSYTKCGKEIAFHPSEVDKMSTSNFWELSGKT